MRTFDSTPIKADDIIPYKKTEKDDLELHIFYPENPLRDELVISPNSPAHLFVRKGKWVYIPAQDEGGFQGKKVGNHLLGGSAAFKLTKQKNSDFTSEGLLKEYAPPAQLYDIEKDPYQSSNVYNENLEITEELHTIISQHREYIEQEDTLGWINLNNT